MSHVSVPFARSATLNLPPVTGALGGRVRSVVTVVDESLDGNLVVRKGDPTKVVPALADEVGADAVYIAEDFGPYGRSRDQAVEDALHEVGSELVRVGSAYAVPPCEIVNKSGDPYKVFTPFSKAWRSHGWPDPIPAPRSTSVTWVGAKSDGIPAAPKVDADLPSPGEDAQPGADDRG
jgi:deoxyribodipyrimidine photo-lyase